MDEDDLRWHPLLVKEDMVLATEDHIEKTMGFLSDLFTDSANFMIVSS